MVSFEAIKNSKFPEATNLMGLREIFLSNLCLNMLTNIIECDKIEVGCKLCFLNKKRLSTLAESTYQ